jgi:site-specific recombinase XerD
MGTRSDSEAAWLARLGDHLRTEKYHPQIVNRWTACARHFLEYLRKRATPVERAQPCHVAGYLRLALRRYVRRHHHDPPGISDWRNSHRSGIHMLLRLVHASWPPAPQPASARDRFQAALLDGYVTWERERRGLAETTWSGRRDEARRFLTWLESHRPATDLQHVTVSDVDAYVADRGASLRRVSLSGVTGDLRSFCRYLYATGRTPRDMSVAIMGPRVYADEAIPSALRAEDIARTLDVTRRDRSALGRRDYAILLLLARYGLRAGEVTALKLSDLDWRHDRVRIFQAKTGVVSELPLLADVGDAILDYLQRGRPSVTFREVFIRNRAPYRPFRSGSSLYTSIRHRLEAAGVIAVGRKGPHAFRHARAVTLLRAMVSAKHIGDILGHRSAESTRVYLKLATEDLRAISLEVPTEVTR